MPLLLLLSVHAFAPPSNGTNGNCPDDESKCYETPGCGWCIDSSYNGGCLAGDQARPFKLPPDFVDCKKQWVPGIYRPPGSMCVMVLSAQDVRCYEQCCYGECPYGQSVAETFVVPSEKACDSYDTAFKSTQAKPDMRKAVHEQISGYLLQKAVDKAHERLMHANSSRPLDMTCV